MTGIFESYDIRGKYPRELNEKKAYKIGRAFITHTKCKNVVVGRDARLSSDKLSKALVEGLRNQGADVTDIGLCTTPMSYFANGFYKFSGSIMVTASHLDKEYNGFKLCIKKAVPISYDTGGKKIEKLVKENKFKDVKQGKYKKKDVLKDYQKFVLKNIAKTKLKVVVDAAHMMGAIDGKILKNICKVIPLDFKTDGRFPKHGVNPLLKKNTADLQHEVFKRNADLGIAFDGDSDRVIFIDEHGKRIPPDLILALLAYHSVKKGQAVVASVQTSLTVQEKVKEKGGKVLLNRTGHSHIKARMRKEKAVLGGEKSGHYYFKEFWNADSPLLAAIKVMQILGKNKKTMSQIIHPYYKYELSGELNFKVKDKKKIMKKIEKLFVPHAKKVLRIDGLSVYTKQFWFNLRESQTEALLRLNLETKSKEKMKEVLHIFKDIMKQH